MAKSTKRPKVDLKPIGKELDSAITALKKLHDSGELTERQMKKLKLFKLPALKVMRLAVEKLCSEHPWHDHDPWFCPPPDPIGQPFGSVAASRRLTKGRGKK